MYVREFSGPKTKFLKKILDVVIGNGLAVVSAFLPIKRLDLDDKDYDEYEHLPKFIVGGGLSINTVAPFVESIGFYTEIEPLRKLGSGAMLVGVDSAFGGSILAFKDADGARDGVGEAEESQRAQ